MSVESIDEPPYGWLRERLGTGLPPGLGMPTGDRAPQPSNAVFGDFISEPRVHQQIEEIVESPLAVPAFNRTLLDFIEVRSVEQRMHPPFLDPSGQPRRPIIRIARSYLQTLYNELERFPPTLRTAERERQLVEFATIARANINIFAEIGLTNQISWGFHYAKNSARGEAEHAKYALTGAAIGDVMIAYGRTIATL